MVRGGAWVWHIVTLCIIVLYASTRALENAYHSQGIPAALVYPRAERDPRIWHSGVLLAPRPALAGGAIGRGGEVPVRAEGERVLVDGLVHMAHAKVKPDEGARLDLVPLALVVVVVNGGGQWWWSMVVVRGHG